ncbi:MAG: PEP/pyruvate-binding domain-containing protein, partial [Candidatus Colwellbacteria bacterium]|nr:PEP/pyruvate-binding domain-containing protein [Candidatus Colwellbacteria bacterium]
FMNEYFGWLERLVTGDMIDQEQMEAILAENMYNFAVEKINKISSVNDFISYYPCINIFSRLVFYYSRHNDDGVSASALIKGAKAEEKLFELSGLDYGTPTGSWNALEQWMNLYSELLSGLPKGKIALSHIIVTMRYLQQGVGANRGFREAANVEIRFPEVRASAMAALEKIPDVLTQRRFVKALGLGGTDMINRLRNQAVVLAQAATGLNDTRQGVVGRIRDRIHNRPSPKDILTVKAYLAFVETGDAAQLGKFDYHPLASDIVPASRKQAAIDAARNLLTTLEDVYGEGSVRTIKEYFGYWKGRVRGQDELVRMIAALLNESPGESFSYLNRICLARSQLYALSRQQRGERLLACIGMLNRLEILYYQQLTMIEERFNYGDSEAAVNIMINPVENVRVNGYSEEEAEIIVSELKELKGKKTFRKQEWLRLYSIYKRIERILNSAAYSAILDYQDMALGIGKGIQAAESIEVTNFSSNLFRSDTIYLLSIAMVRLKAEAMKKACVSGWQVVVSGQTQGRVRFVGNTEELAACDAGSIVVIESIPPEAAPVIDVRGIITLKEDSLLSHPAIRARQFGIPFAVCPDKELLAGLEGKWVSLKAQGETVTLKQVNGPVSNKSPPPERAGRPIELISVDLDRKEIILSSACYQQSLVGNKAFRLNQIPADIVPDQIVPRHMSLGFGLFLQVLDQEINAEVKAEIAKLMLTLMRSRKKESISAALGKIRKHIEELVIPDEYLELILVSARGTFGAEKRLFLRSSTNAEDLHGYQAAGLYDSFGNVHLNKEHLAGYIRKVWASVWNERAYFDRAANGVSHSGVYAAVLLQEMIHPAYAFVIHTHNPQGKDGNEAVIEIVHGLGEALVSGSEEFSGAPYRFVYNRKNNKFSLVGFANKSRKLVLDARGRMRPAYVSYRDDPIVSRKGKALVKQILLGSLRIEDSFGGYPQDIEGALVRDNGTWQVAFLQSRDQPLVNGRARENGSFSVLDGGTFVYVVSIGDSADKYFPAIILAGFGPLAWDLQGGTAFIQSLSVIQLVFLSTVIVIFVFVSSVWQNVMSYLRNYRELTLEGLMKELPVIREMART